MMKPVLQGMAGAACTMLSWSASAAQPKEDEDFAKLDLASLMRMEVTVTTQKRMQRPLDVPVSLAVFSDVDLRSLGATNTQSLTERVPGLRMISSGSDAITTLSLRGVGQRNVADQNEGATILFVDGTYVSFQGAIAQPFFDLERVEVVKGPQGTLFGRNATGGFVHAVSKRPTREHDGYLSVGYGSFDNVRLEGALSGPLSKTTSARLSLSAETYDGYVDNIGGGPDSQASTNYSARLQLLFEPTSQFSVLINARGSIWPSEQGPASRAEPLIVDSSGTQRSPRSYAEYSAWCTSRGFAPPPPGSERHGNCFAAQPADDFQVASSRIPNQADYYGVSGTAEWKLSDEIMLTSISDYQYLQRRFANELDGTAADLLSYQARVPHGSQYSQELRLNGASERLDWIAGLYGLYIDNDLETNFENRNAPPFLASFQTAYTQITKSQAAFAQVEYDFRPEWTLIVGARLTHDYKSIDNVSRCVPGALVPVICNALAAGFPPNTVAFTGFRDEFSENDWSARAILQWRPDPDLRLYAGINRGTKSGGFNSGIFEGYTPDQAEFAAEVLTAYEGGIKSMLADGRVHLNGSLFYYDYRDFQTFELLGTGQFTFNVDADVKGAEMELAMQPAVGWGVRTAVLWLDAMQRDVPTGTGVQDFPIPDAPRWSATGSVRYAWPISSGRVAAIANGSYVGRRTSTAITFHDTEAPSYVRLDARVTYTADHERWSLSAFVNNLTDESIESIVVPSAGLSGSKHILYEKPRWVGASFTLSF